MRPALVLALIALLEGSPATSRPAIHAAFGRACELGGPLRRTVASAQPPPANAPHDEGDVPPAVMPAPPTPLGVQLPIRFRVARDATGELTFLEPAAGPSDPTSRERRRQATEPNEWVRDKRWLVAQTERASAVFAPAGITFVPASVEPLDRADLETRDDRHGLARHLERGVINVFVVRAMRDVDDPTQWRRGVHWRLPWRRERHFVIVTEVAPPTTLAHELGHFFGNPKHRWVPGNVMSYDAGDAPTFDPDQLHRVVAHARRFLRSGELVTNERLGELTARGELPRRWDGVEPPGDARRRTGVE